MQFIVENFLNLIYFGEFGGPVNSVLKVCKLKITNMALNEGL